MLALMGVLIALVLAVPAASHGAAGIDWMTRTSAADNQWRSVTYGNGLFVAVSDTGAGNRVMTSPDGATWTMRSSAADNAWWSVTYGDGHAPGAYKRLDAVLAHHQGTIRVTHRLRPIGVAMAGSDVEDPYKD